MTNKYTEEPDSWEDFSQKELVMIGVVGIQDPLRNEVPDAVRACQKAGVVVRMVTGDNLVTAKNIAKNCGIYVDENEKKSMMVMEGPKFRNLQDQEMNEIIPKLRVLARSSPLDKQILVNKLKELGEVVAVTGDGTNDAPALKVSVFLLSSFFFLLSSFFFFLLSSSFFFLLFVYFFFLFLCFLLLFSSFSFPIIDTEPLPPLPLSFKKN